MLESEGFATDKAIDGIEALDKAISILPDVILLDIGLPGMDGYEVARRIRRSKIIGGARIIALTGWGGARDRELALKAGIDSHLVKPIVIDDLLTHLRGVPIATDMLAKA
ncbi:MAG: response regulator [Planctomycetales bacterium]|nr:response regulator [Planctomycetales bacterium]